MIAVFAFVPVDFLTEYTENSFASLAFIQVAIRRYTC
jgi:hypothetical protein